jgi:hypothetical protein
VTVSVHGRSQGERVDLRGGSSAVLRCGPGRRQPLGGLVDDYEHLGPGPRDGLWVAVTRRYGWSIRVVRTVIELTVLVIGWLMGGVVGVGTVLYAVSIGHINQFFMPYVQVAKPVLDEPVEAVATTH